jgi:hypothetical protein
MPMAPPPSMITPQIVTPLLKPSSGVAAISTTLELGFERFAAFRETFHLRATAIRHREGVRPTMSMAWPEGLGPIVVPKRKRARRGSSTC